MTVIMKVCIVFYLVATCLAMVTWFHLNSIHQKYLIFGMIYLYAPAVYFTCTMMRILCWDDLKMKLQRYIGRWCCCAFCGESETGSLDVEELTTMMTKNEKLTDEALWNFWIRTTPRGCADYCLLQFLLVATPDPLVFRRKFRSPKLCNDWTEEKSCEDCSKMEEVLIGTGLLPANSYSEEVEYSPSYDSLSLLHFARLATRKCLSPNVFHGSERLPLPQSLRSYLLFDLTPTDLASEMVLLYMAMVKQQVKRPQKSKHTVVTIERVPIIRKQIPVEE